MAIRELLSRLPNIFTANTLWTTALFDEPATFEAGDQLSSEPFYRFDTKRLRRKRSDVASRADPFLWARDDKLYLFMEAEPEIGPGRIEAWVTIDLREFTSLGDVLREPFHLSYPFVFADGERLFMIPESSEAAGVFLYEFDHFPTGLRRVRKLLEGWYVDSSIIELDGSWFLFTTSREGLEIFITDDLMNGELKRHRGSPVTSDARISRSGGGVLRTSDGLVRLAQDCSAVYGANLNLVAIDEMTPQAYSEHLVGEHLYPCDRVWNALGIHHQSYLRFRGRTIVAMDGRQRDYYLHRVRGLMCRAAGL